MADQYQAAAEEQQIDGGSEFEELDAQIKDGLDADPEAGGEGGLEEEEPEGLEEPEEEQPPAAAEKRSGKAPMVPLKGLQEERRKRQALEKEVEQLRANQSEASELYYRATGQRALPLIGEDVIPPKKEEAKPQAMNYAPLADKVAAKLNLDKDMPLLSVEEVTAAVTTTIDEYLQEKNAEAAQRHQIEAAEREENERFFAEAYKIGLDSFGEEEWKSIINDAEEYRKADPELYKLIMKKVFDPEHFAEATYLVAEFKRQKQAAIAQATAAGTQRVLGNIKQQLARPRTATGATAPNPADGFEKYKILQKQGKRREAVLALDDEIING
jgi:hypothetical protein